MKKIIVLLCLITGVVSQAEAQGLKRVSLNGKYGYTDNEGKEIIPFNYDYAFDFLEGLAMVKLNNYYGFIDSTGKEIIPIKYESGWSFIENLAKVKLNGKWGFIDKTGKEIIPFKYDDVKDFKGGFAFVMLNSKWAFIDTTGKEITTFKYDDVFAFYEKSAAVKQNGKWGYIDQTGEQIIEFKYDEYSSFEGGIALVSAGSKYGYIDTTGKQILPFIYGDRYSAATAYKKMKEEELNPAKVTPLIVKDKPEAEKYLRSDIIIYDVNGKLGLKKTDGTILTHPHFSQITFERSPSMEFLYHLTGILYDTYYHAQKVDIWYQPYQEKINPDYIVGYFASSEACFTCKGTGVTTIDETEKVWVPPSTISSGSSTNTQTHADIYSEKRGTVTTTTTTTSTKTIPGYYKEVKTGTKNVSCTKCKNGTKIRRHNYTYNSYSRTYIENVSQ